MNTLLRDLVVAAISAALLVAVIALIIHDRDKKSLEFHVPKMWDSSGAPRR